MLIIFGCGGHSRSVADILLANQPDVELVFVDKNAKKGETLWGFPILKEVPLHREPYFFAIGDNLTRKNWYLEIGSLGLISVVSSRAYLGKKMHQGKGVFIGNFAHIGPEAAIGDNTIINNGAIVEHGVSIGKHCHIAPRVAISGTTQIGDLCFIGTGASIRDGIKICSNVIIGAGSTVIDDITEEGTYVGSPARKLANV